MGPHFNATAQLSASITRDASLQSYLTIRFLADRKRVADAYRAYAYFRWVDDRLDLELRRKSERVAFLNRQAGLIEDCYQHRPRPDAGMEEQVLVDLIRGDAQPGSGLACYIRNMIAVMAFDVERRGRQITRSELRAYTHRLAVAVTEALHYFISQRELAPRTESRYLSVTGAHIAHMLRDTWEDNEAGYFNIPLEVLQANRLSPWDVRSPPYREWVRSRVESARNCFRRGGKYTAESGSIRFRLAADAYVARFAGILGSIERHDYILQPVYPQRRSLRGGLELGWLALSLVLRDLIPAA
jgi:phytoene/squalene synthetase